MAVYNSEGVLERFGSTHIPSKQDIPSQVPCLLREVLGDNSPSHIILEGDLDLCAAWTSAIEKVHTNNLLIAKIEPHQWRKSVLTAKEMQSGRNAKAAARLISRQIVWKSGLPLPQGSMNTDAAEAILIGFWAVHHYGLRDGYDGNGLSRTTPHSLIERYTNGNVVLPPASYAVDKSVK
jgi:hypothetical protein